MGTQSKRSSVLISRENQIELPQQKEVKEKGWGREQDSWIGKGVAQAGFVSSLLRRDELMKQLEVAERELKDLKFKNEQLTEDL